MAARIVIQARIKFNQDREQRELASGLSDLVPRLQSEDAVRAIKDLAQALAEFDDSSRSAFGTPFRIDPRTQTLSKALVGNDPTLQSRTATALTLLFGSLAGTEQPFPSLVGLRLASTPLPCRLSEQQLVDLLKQPTCTGPIRRVILDQLQNRYHHEFADHWAFVRFAQEQNLGLDFID